MISTQKGTRVEVLGAAPHAQKASVSRVLPERPCGAELRAAAGQRHPQTSPHLASPPSSDAWAHCYAPTCGTLDLWKRARALQPTCSKPIHGPSRSEGECSVCCRVPSTEPTKGSGQPGGGGCRLPAEPLQVLGLAAGEATGRRSNLRDQVSVPRGLGSAVHLLVGRVRRALLGGAFQRGHDGQTGLRC